MTRPGEIAMTTQVFAYVADGSKRLGLRKTDFARRPAEYAGLSLDSARPDRTFKTQGEELGVSKALDRDGCGRKWKQISVFGRRAPGVYFQELRHAAKDEGKETGLR